MPRESRGVGRMEFLANLDEIKDRVIDRGEPIKLVHKDLSERQQVNISYKQFTVYVRTITGEHDTKITAPKKPRLNAPQKPKNEPSGTRQGKTVALDFKGAESPSLHDPKANIDELI